MAVHSNITHTFLNRGCIPSFFMDEQDYKYLIVTYQQKIFDILSQFIASEAKVKKLMDINENLSKEVAQQKEELQKLSLKAKKNIKGDEFQ